MADRALLILGDSAETIPQFSRAVKGGPFGCDVIISDFGHNSTHHQRVFSAMAEGLAAASAIHISMHIAETEGLYDEWREFERAGVYSDSLTLARGAMGVGRLKEP